MELDILRQILVKLTAVEQDVSVIKAEQATMREDITAIKAEQTSMREDIAVIKARQAVDSESIDIVIVEVNKINRSLRIHNMAPVS